MRTLIYRDIPGYIHLGINNITPRKSRLDRLPDCLVDYRDGGEIAVEYASIEEVGE